LYLEVMISALLQKIKKVTILVKKWSMCKSLYATSITLCNKVVSNLFRERLWVNCHHFGRRKMGLI